MGLGFRAEGLGFRALWVYFRGLGCNGLAVGGGGGGGGVRPYAAAFWH